MAEGVARRNFEVKTDEGNAGRCLLSRHNVKVYLPSIQMIRGPPSAGV